MVFISDDLWSEITQAAKVSKKPADVAVAYMGTNGDKLLPVRAKSRIVVDASLASVRAGSTNPTPLLALHKRGVRIFSRPLLHAKTFVFDSECFVGSGNASYRSANQLAEAAIRTSDTGTIQSARAFVRGVATDELDEQALEWLRSKYKPPKAGTNMAPQESAPVLLMELIDNQGYSGHQVQPPQGVWARFFRVTANEERNLTFRNRDTGSVFSRKIVSHALVRTVDIPEADAGTIWEVRQVGLDRYEYRVFRPNQAEFGTSSAELANAINPFQGRGRKWLIKGAPQK